MTTDNFRPKGEFFVDVALMRAAMARFKLRPATDLELPRGIALTERLLGASIADIEVILRLHASTGITAWVTGDPVEGFMITVPLTKGGEAAVRNGSFVPADPSQDYVAARGQPCHAIYVGVYAGETRDARRNIMQASAIVRVELFGSVPCFARAATDDGARSMRSLGFGPIDGGLPDLWVQEPLSGMVESAA